MLLRRTAGVDRGLQIDAFIADPKPGGASTETEENSVSVGFDQRGIMSETEGRTQSASNPLHFLVPTQEIRTCGGQLFEPSETQVTKGRTL